MKHRAGGNCWEGIQSPQDEDVCLKHEEPRGECESCPRCPLCDSAMLKDALDKPIETKTVVVQPTASKTDRFLACAYPWGLEVAVEGEVDAAARFGSAFHEGLAICFGKGNKAAAFRIDWKRLAAKYGPDINPQALRERVLAAYPVLTAWLRQENPWGINFYTWKLRVECALTYDIEAGTARWCALPDESHEYTDRRPNELPGTADVLGAGKMVRKHIPKRVVDKRNTVLILDHKSGWAVGSPRESGQLRSLALAACRLHHVDRAIVAFLHAPHDMAPTVYADTLDASELEQHAADLKLANSRRGDGSMRPGPHCKWCQAFSICPTNAGALTEIRGAAMATAEDVGLAHARLADFRRRFADIDAMVDAEIRSWIKQHGEAIRPDGCAVDFVERDYTNLSQASIVRALGKLEGGRMIARLKKLGCIEESRRRELRVIK